MLDHVSITVSDIAAAEGFYDAIMTALGVVKVGGRDDWLGYGERSRPDYPDRVYISIRKGEKPDDASGRHWCFKARWRTQVDAFWDAGIPMNAKRLAGTGIAGIPLDLTITLIYISVK
jgi:catechol 2,3-dioxygenase-like lactoylglutathione lyase family enzyme